MFFLHIGIFFFSDRGYFLVLSAPGRAGNPSDYHGASVGPDRDAGHVLWGLNSQVTTWRNSEHVEPSRSMQTHVQDKNMSDDSCEI